MKILIIEDDIEYMNVLKKMLERQDYEVITAVDGEDGITKYKKNLPDIVITDLMMPVIGGLKVILELKEQFPKIKIIAISGGGELEAEKYLLVSKTLKADRALKKPFHNDELLQAISEILD